MAIAPDLSVPVRRRGIAGRRVRRLAFVLAAWIGLLWVAGWTLFPIAWIFITSLKVPSETITLPPRLIFSPTLENYAGVLAQSDLRQFLLNTVIVSTVTTLLVVVFGTLAGYALSRFRFAGSRSAFFFIVAVRTMPPVAAIVPTFMLFKTLGQMDSYAGIIALYTAFTVSFVVIMMKAFFDEIPVDLEEAAMIDGCSRTGAFLRVALPLVAPGLAGTSIFAFMSSWNEFFFALIFTSRVAKTAPVALAQFVGETGIDWGRMSAAATLVMVPSLVLTWIVQRNLVRGLTVGAVK